MTENRKRRRRLTFPGILLVFTLLVPSRFLAAGPVGDAEIKLKFGHVGAPGSLFALSAGEYARRVQTELGGRVEIQVFGSSQLGGDKQMLRKLRLGSLDFSLPSTIMSSEISSFGLFEMPYLIKNRVHMARIEREIVWPKLAPVARSKGYEILAVWENGYRHVTNNRRPIRVPSDLRGIKLRVPRGIWRVRMFQTYGANPSPMALSEVFVALQTGVMDGEENPLQQIYTSKLHEVQKYLSLTRHVYTPAFVVVGRRKWEQLPPDVRESLTRIARETQTFVYATAARLEKKCLEAIRKEGVRINQVDRESFLESSRVIYEIFASEVPAGRELIDKAVDLGAEITSPKKRVNGCTG